MHLLHSDAEKDVRAASAHGFAGQAYLERDRGKTEQWVSWSFQDKYAHRASSDRKAIIFQLVRLPESSGLACTLESVAVVTLSERIERFIANSE